MPKGTRVCKVCGKEYEYCRTAYPNSGIYRWQDVACCVEHGAEYFARVMEARGESIARNTAQEDADLEIVYEQDNADDFDELFESDFENDDSDLDIG